MAIPFFQEKLDALVRNYVKANPNSQAANEGNAQWLPGGNTRSVLHYDPFPVMIAQGQGSHVVDLDAHRYLDCVGEFSAGLYGHRQPAIQAALTDALTGGLTLGGPNLWEGRLAQAICNRFTSIERVRFCNSGTEANLFALVTACAITRRDTVLVFDGAYHGGVLTFAGGGSPTNVPFDWQVLPYNDTDTVRDWLRQHGQSVAAILVEPILGAAGNIPADPGFLQVLREEATACGAMLIFDEVKTSRCGPGGMQGLLGITPDMTTFGKYIGGGLPMGGFGGRTAIMDRYDPRQPGALKHAGTFNNNVLSMAAGAVGLTEIYTPERAEAFHERTERFKHDLEHMLQRNGLHLNLSGHGSMFSVNVGTRPPRKASDVTQDTIDLRRLMHLRAMEMGVRLASRGDIYLNIAMTDDDLETLADVLLQSAAEMLSPTFSF